MDNDNKKLIELQKQMYSLTRAKFQPPYLEEAVRKAVDAEILSTWLKIKELDD